MPKKAGKLTIFKEENTMTANLTLNDLTIEQASALLTLLEQLKGAETITQEQVQEGVPLFEEPAPAQAAESPAPDTADSPVSYTIEQVRAAFTKYAKTNGKEAAKELLIKYGAGKVTELKESDYAAVMKEVS